ncbi:hypothetical protein [Ectopseudomonas khazarica]|uniref:hypothetical protein n=1 Tax=Ectopseudomonas khazarica TaxID=2502979 RepID=UPI003A8D95E3
MELTTFTTAQVYGIFAALSCAAFSGILFYCLGLRNGNAAGYELGRSTAKTYWINRISHIRSDLGEARDLLDARTREMAALRQSIAQETADHAATVAKLREHMHFAENDRENVIRDLLAALQEETSKRLTSDDWLTLKLAAKQLGIAAHQIARSGTSKTNQAALAQSQVNALAERTKAILDQPPRLCEYDYQGITDTDLIEWLDRTAVTGINPDEGQATITFNAYGSELPEHLRDLLTKAKVDSDDIDQHGAEALRLAVQEDAA